MSRVESPIIAVWAIWSTSGLSAQAQSVSATSGRSLMAVFNPSPPQMLACPALRANSPKAGALTMRPTVRATHPKPASSIDGTYVNPYP